MLLLGRDEPDVFLLLLLPLPRGRPCASRQGPPPLL